jgi:hypothetical protein
MEKKIQEKKPAQVGENAKKSKTAAPNNNNKPTPNSVQDPGLERGLGERRLSSYKLMRFENLLCAQ